MITEKGHSIEELTQFAMKAITRAGEESLNFYGRGRASCQFDEGLITRAELHLNDFFQKYLSTRFPAHRVFPHKQMDNTYTHDEQRYLWVYDPIDGVSNFQAGIPIWGTSLALLENFWPVFGIFHMPATGDFFHARAEGNAFRGDTEILISAQETLDDESLLLTYSRFHQDYQCRFPGKVRALGCTTAHICYVAMGRAEAAVLANETFQDLAAARIIVEAAGGKIFKMDGTPFFLNEYLDIQRIDTPLIVSGPASCEQIRKCLQRR